MQFDYEVLAAVTFALSALACMGIAHWVERTRRP